MSTLEATLSMLETMPEEARKKVYEYTKSLYTSPRPANPYTPLTEDKVMADLALATMEFEAGKGLDAKEAIQEMRKQHGFV